MADGVARTSAEMEDQIDKAGDAGQGFAASRWPGMTYEQGVVQALRWVAGDEDVPPMDEG